MKVADTILALQSTLGIPEGERAPRVGRKTRAAFERLAASDPNAEWNPNPIPAPETGRDINAAGLELVKHFESLFLTAYQDTGGIWTIGWGHTGLQHNDGTVYPGRVITREKAEELLRYDMNQFEARVAALIRVPLNDDQFSALVSFDFNTGGLTLDEPGNPPSTLTRKLNFGDYAGAAEEFPRWNKDNGRVLAGLVRRRASERRLFLSQHPAIIAG